MSSIEGARTALVKVEWAEPRVRVAWRALTLRTILRRFAQRDWTRATELDERGQRRVVP